MAIKKLDKMYRKALKDLSDDWRKEYHDLQDEYSEKLEALTKSNEELEQTLKRYSREYKETLAEINRRYNQSVDSLEKDFKSKYEQDRRELETAATELREATQRYEELASDLEEFRGEMEEAVHAIEAEFERTTGLLKEQVDRKYDAIISDIDRAKELDPRLSRHSDGRVDNLRKRVDGIKYTSETDRFYHYAEMMVCCGELSDAAEELRHILEDAAEVHRKEIAMIAVRKMVLAHLKGRSGRYTILDVRQPCLWKTVFVRYCDEAGNVYMLYANERGFSLEVWPYSGDGRVGRELKMRMNAEIGGLYRDQSIEMDSECNAKAEFVVAATNNLKRRRKQSRKEA